MDGTGKKTISQEQAQAELDRYAAQYHDKDDIREEVNRHGEGAEQKGMFGALKKYLEAIKDVVAMLRDVVSGEYKEAVPFATLASLAGAVAYIACPIDLVPDVFPFIGLADDAVVFALVMEFAGKDLKRYRAWRKQKNNDGKE